ncbi:MAG: hypothetical protein P9X26_05685 [Candidatus Stygibacter frigidus]|nr:hypothetical protein [Candidatus Stygibacter frigidus]
MKHVRAVIFLGIIGLIIGYLIFGNVNGKLVSVNKIFGSDDNIVERTLDNVAGLDKAREKILVSGAIGALAGLLISVIKGKKK